MALSWQRRAVGVGVVLVGKDKNIAAARLHHGFEALVYAQVACIHVVYAQVACICMYVCVCVNKTKKKAWPSGHTHTHTHTHTHMTLRRM